MFRLLIDHNLDHRIIRGLRLRISEIDFVACHDVGLAAAPDPEVLEWAASAGRILVTHDARTIPPFAYQRLAAGLPMPGVIVVRKSVAIGPAIDDLLLILTCCQPEELDGQVYDVPV